MADQPRPEHILQVGLGFWGSKTLLSAVEMGLFTELAEHPAEFGPVRDRLGLHPRSAADFHPDRAEARELAQPADLELRGMGPIEHSPWVGRVLSVR